jgi:serine/threonine protein kinase/formylglycine-generating enzyme required for sulfatase activity
MNEPRASSGQLPQAIEDEVLAILEGDEVARDEALRALLLAHSQHSHTIREWLRAAGVPVPPGQGGDIDSDTALPLLLGPYLLQECLGRGGFGTVFRGEQQEPIRRPVAVKIMNPGMDSRDLLARFAAEREALNRMDHPGIARLLDAGATPKGRPYFVMELVAGPTLLTHCRQRRLPVRARVELFLLVLDAMQHAHQKAMLHRDLSSNNVLVADPDGAAQPKIIDFGIAKSLDDPLLQGGALTMRGTLLGTPEFMSPEQAAGSVEDIDTRADVYSLGAQLYELLSDQLPIPGVVLRSQGLAGMAEVVRTYQPALPSEAGPRERRGELRGDLDSIVAKAIAKVREDRYGSVGEFAADLRRHLAYEPVAVSKPSSWYRMRRFVRRHRGESLALGVAAVGLLAAFVLMASSLRMAHAAKEDAQRLQQQADAQRDAGRQLFASEERLAAAIAAEAALPPPWPEYADDYDRWLREHALPLGRERDTLRERFDALAPHGAAATTTDVVTMRYFDSARARLDKAFVAFHAEGGPLREVQRRQKLLADVIAPAMAAHAADWHAAIAAIEHCDGTTVSRDYRGLRVPALPGLVPLGPDPTTKLYEFVDLASHAPGYPLPVRDATGVLRTDAGSGIVFVLLPAGRLDEGAYKNRPGVDGNDELAAEDELHGGSVQLDAFLIARTELTQAQWNRLAGRVTLGDDPLLPVTDLEWSRASAVLDRFGMQLPTEAQWEYACSAHGRWPWSTGAAIEDVVKAGWFTHGLQPVGLLAPNAFGLYDMHGNAAEWCEDEKLPYDDSTTRHGDGLRERKVPRHGEELRVVRGGAWHQGPQFARATARDARSPASRDATIGVRPVRPLRTTR